jgi:hypothetical protein
MSDARKPAGPAGLGPAGLKQSIERLDALLAAETSEEKIRAGMGIRLALGMAQELKAGKPLGSETAELVSNWTAHFGEDAVNAAVKIAREFLTKPETMRTALGQKLGLEPGATGNGHGSAELEDAGDAGYGDAEDDAADDVEPGEAP